MTPKKIAKAFVMATLLALGIRLFILEDYRIASASMMPALLVGDLVFVWKSAFNLRIPFSSYEVVKLRRPKKGDIVAFTLPDQGVETFVKRVVALGGDRVEIKDGYLVINGEKEALEKVPTQESRFQTHFAGGHTHEVIWDPKQIPSYGPVDVPKDHFFVLGDNRIDSIDSRTWGPVPNSCLKGQPFLIWFSVDRTNGFRPSRIGKAVL